MTKNRGKYWLLSPTKISPTTHHAEGNSMAGPTQTVVGKDIPYQLIPEDLLKFLTDLIPPESLTNSLPWNDRITNCIFFPAK